MEVTALNPDTTPYQCARFVRTTPDLTRTLASIRRSELTREVPDGTCRVCGDEATRFYGSSRFCDLHYKAMVTIVNHGGSTRDLKAVAPA